MKRLLFPLVVLLAAGAAYEGMRHWTIRTAAAAPMHVLPFTMEFWEYDSAGKLLDQRTVARSADGSEAMVMVTQPRGQIARRVDYMDGRVMTALDALQIKMSGYLAGHNSEFRRNRLLHPPADCLWKGETVTGRILLPGNIQAVKIARWRPSGSAFRISETRAVDYGCETVEGIGEDQQPDGTWTTRFHSKLIYFQPGEPDSRLFEPGDKYQEMKPSGVRDVVLTQLGITPQACPKCYTDNFASMDANYTAMQKPLP
jgi:hypothetical protein